MLWDYTLLLSISTTVTWVTWILLEPSTFWQKVFALFMFPIVFGVVFCLIVLSALAKQDAKKKKSREEHDGGPGKLVVR